MGITIYWQGKLRDKGGLNAAVQAVRDFARERGWIVRDMPPQMREHFRIVGEDVVTAIGPTCGIITRPHRDCEAVIFEFDREGVVQASCKTQFAGPEVHIAVLDLLRAVAPHFADFKVIDEAGYWETGDASTLKRRFESMDRAINALAERLGAEKAVGIPLDEPDDDPSGVRH